MPRKKKRVSNMLFDVKEIKKENKPKKRKTRGKKTKSKSTTRKSKLQKKLKVEKKQKNNEKMFDYDKIRTRDIKKFDEDIEVIYWKPIKNDGYFILIPPVKQLKSLMEGYKIVGIYYKDFKPKYLQYSIPDEKLKDLLSVVKKKVKEHNKKIYIRKD